jgi:putative methyltransferase
MDMQEKKMLKIYLCDLVYDTVKTNYVVPLNIAYIAAYIKKQYADAVEIKLFKYPMELEKAIKISAPDIIGFSNYSWNERLNHLFIKMAKRQNPNVLTVMGGPNIRTENDEIKDYLSANSQLDYYILFEGEEPFCNLVGKALAGDETPTPPSGCAGLIEGELHFKPLDIKKRSKQIDLPSPYLTGLLDHFLADPNMIPLFETNRGCPFGCTYCTWGIAALSKLRQRPLDIVYEEMDYVARKSAKQVDWIFCDANFGILKRDVEIAKRIRQIMDTYGYPINVTLWHSKNTGERNIEIAKLLRDSDGYIAIQSSDPVVLKNCGRGNIQSDDLKAQINYYKEKNFEVSTDILTGLPGETAKSHLNSLMTAFDLGFGKIQPYNIRMLPGSQYESKPDRLRYGVETKFRPIFGAYGEYGGQRVFEIEESVRATKDMTEPELESFKKVHWLIYFCWNTGFFKPLLRFGQRQGANPGVVLHRLSNSSHPSLIDLFSKMTQESMTEWFESRQAMIQHYSHKNNFDKIVNNFVKLNSLWIARLYQDPGILSILLSETEKIIKEMIRTDDRETNKTLKEILQIINKLKGNDLLQKEFVYKDRFTGESLSYVLNDTGLPKKKIITVEIFRNREDVLFCNYHLNPNGKKDFSLQNVTRFLEMGGGRMLTNRIRVVSN